MLKQLKPALIIFALLTVITGVIYPLLITSVVQLFFSHQANGSLIINDGNVVGSKLIGQQFDQPQYFWGRLSATGSYPYNAAASGGSNFSVLNETLQKQVEARLAALKAADPGNTQPVPVDLVTASGSGLDPHISIAAALYQVGRVARVHGLTLDQVTNLVNQYTEPRQLGFLGEPRVNVLELNLALDRIQ
jgi:potassium-transporting ATPase KdpC subunit